MFAWRRFFIFLYYIFLGKFTYSKSEILNKLKTNQLIPIRYCDSRGKPTQKYPENPNGSEDGVAGLCSTDGRHLAL